MRLERIMHRCPTEDVFLDLFIGGRESRQELQDLADLSTRNDHNTIHGVAEDEVAGVHAGAVNLEGDLDGPGRARCPCADGGEAACPDLQGVSAGDGGMREEGGRLESSRRTGRPVLLSSTMSLARPATMMPRAPRTFIRSAMMPPQTAFFWPSGCCMTTIVPEGVRSAQWASPGMLAGGSESFWLVPLGTNRTVDAGAMVTAGASVLGATSGAV